MRPRAISPDLPHRRPRSETRPRPTPPVPPRTPTPTPAPTPTPTPTPSFRDPASTRGRGTPQATLSSLWNAGYAIGWAAGPLLGGALYGALASAPLCVSPPDLAECDAARPPEGCSCEWGPHNGFDGFGQARLRPRPRGRRPISPRSRRGLHAVRPPCDLRATSARPSQVVALTCAGFGCLCALAAAGNVRGGGDGGGGARRWWCCCDGGEAEAGARAEAAEAEVLSAIVASPALPRDSSGTSLGMLSARTPQRRPEPRPRSL